MADSLKEAFADVLKEEQKKGKKGDKDIVSEMVKKNFMDIKPERQKEQASKKAERLSAKVREKAAEILTNEVIDKYLGSYRGKQREKMGESLEERLGQFNDMLSKNARKGALDLDARTAVEKEAIDFFRKKKFSKLVGILEGQEGGNEEESGNQKEAKKANTNPKQKTMEQKEGASPEEEEQKVEAKEETAGIPQTVEDFRKMFGIGPSGKKNFVSVRDGSDLQITSFDPKSKRVSFEVAQRFKMEGSEKDEDGELPVYSIGEKGGFKTMPFSDFQEMMQQRRYVPEDEYSKEEIKHEWSKLEGQEKIDVSGVYRNEKGDFLSVGKYMQGERATKPKEGEKKKQEKKWHRKAGTFSVSVNGEPVQFISAQELRKILDEGGYEFTDERYEDVIAQSKKNRETEENEKEAGKSVQEKKEGNGEKKIKSKQRPEESETKTENEKEKGEENKIEQEAEFNELENKIIGQGMKYWEEYKKETDRQIQNDPDSAYLVEKEVLKLKTLLASYFWTYKLPLRVRKAGESLGIAPEKI